MKFFIGFGELSKADFYILVDKSYSFYIIVSNIFQHTFVLSDRCLYQVVATPVFV